jgi:hypothetical protein
VCGRNLITGLTSAASPRMDISSACKVGQKLWVSLPLLTCFPSAWPSRLLYRRGWNSRRVLRITLSMWVRRSRELESILEEVIVAYLSKLCVHFLWTNEEYDGPHRVLPFLSQKGTAAVRVLRNPIIAWPQANREQFKQHINRTLRNTTYIIWINKITVSNCLKCRRERQRLGLLAYKKTVIVSLRTLEQRIWI